jgi:hypothetical protein
MGCLVVKDPLKMEISLLRYSKLIVRNLSVKSNCRSKPRQGSYESFQSQTEMKKQHGITYELSEYISASKQCE